MKTYFKAAGFLIAAISISQSYLFAQDKLSLKFGKISPADFELSQHKFDTSAGAVYIADIGTTEFEGNTKGWFSLVFKRHARIKILKKDGFDAADVQIPLYTSLSGNSEEKLSKVSAATYHLENGKVTVTKLEESNIFKDRINKNYVVRKFTLPGVKEGAIIEFTYTITSDFLFNLQPWQFQGAYPRLWSEYNVRMPEFFNYVFLSQGAQNFHVKTSKESFGTFNLTEQKGLQSNNFFKLDGRIIDSRWVMKDVPALKEEPFTTSLNNHIAKIEFQLSQYRFPNTIPEDIMGNWTKASENLLKDEDFGATLSKNNNWLDEDLKAITANATSKLEKARKIYAYVRDNYTATGNGTRLSTALKNTFKSRNGSVADINLLLIAMLRHENITAEPVLLSTRSHGLSHAIYPLMDRFNYVIARVVDNEKTFYLDASQPRLGFNHLPIQCYNGHSRIISDNPEPIFLLADSLAEKKITLVNFGINDKGTYTGSFVSTLGYYESLNMREILATQGKDNYLKKLKASYSDNFEVSDLQIDSLSQYENPLAVKYQLSFKNIGTEDIIYFNPMLSEGYKHNDFKSAQRAYPVEMPYTFDRTYIINIRIPEGYEVDELPKSTRVGFNEGEGAFEYIVAKNGDLVQMRSRIQMKKANFIAEDYEGLRSFFDYVVKKHSEQIVFKKKK